MFLLCLLLSVLRDCIGARDPYCYWNTTSSTCVHYSVNTTAVASAEAAHDLPSEYD